LRLLINVKNNKYFLYNTSFAFKNILRMKASDSGYLANRKVPGDTTFDSELTASPLGNLIKITNDTHYTQVSTGDTLSNDNWGHCQTYITGPMICVCEVCV